VVARLEHCGDELTSLNTPLSRGCLRCGTHEIFAVSVERVRAVKKRLKRADQSPPGHL
jgi:hypothetical protein